MSESTSSKVSPMTEDAADPDIKTDSTHTGNDQEEQIVTQNANVNQSEKRAGGSTITTSTLASVTPSPNSSQNSGPGGSDGARARNGRKFLNNGAAGAVGAAGTGAGTGTGEKVKRTFEVDAEECSD